MKLKFYTLILLCIFVGYGPSFSQKDKDKPYDKHKKDYIDKARVELNIEERFAERLYDKKVNINAYKEFKKVGIDLKKYVHKLAGLIDFKENSLGADLVILGTVIKIEYESNKRAYYASTYTIRTEEVLLGEDMYKPMPDQVIIKRESGPFRGVSFETVALEIGNKYIFFLTRNMLEQMKTSISRNEDMEYYWGAAVFPSIEELDNKFVFLEMPYSTLRVKSAFVYDRFGRLKPSFDLVKKTIKQIEKINDRKNFKNKDYRIEGGN